jgi:hypothetical protein
MYSQARTWLQVRGIERVSIAKQPKAHYHALPMAC